ncbi:MAG: hypothetical protein DDT20_01532 [Firmicutes bacterium]|nr:hypothetical protein [Bacillota bacterium]
MRDLGGRSAVVLGPAKAKEMGLTEGQEIKVRFGSRRVKGVVLSTRVNSNEQKPHGF